MWLLLPLLIVLGPLGDKAILVQAGNSGKNFDGKEHFVRLHARNRGQSCAAMLDDIFYFVRIDDVAHIGNSCTGRWPMAEQKPLDLIVKIL